MVIKWHRVDRSILGAADLGHLASGPNFQPLDPKSLEIVRGRPLLVYNF